MAVLVIYVDMDYFFAACEELRRPELKGKPLVVVTHDGKEVDRGVVQTCNYEARKFGIRSGMPSKKAFGLCKELSCVKADDAYYEGISAKVMAYLKRFGMPVEQDSVDEAAIGLAEGSYEDAIRIAKNMKKGILDDIGLPCTVGISFGKVFAKMVCDASKPNGFGIVKEEDIEKFLKGKSVGKLPGVGPKTEQRLNKLGIRSVDELAKANPTRVVTALGSIGTEFYRLAKGIDDSKILENGEVLSIGRERTLDSETNDPQRIGVTVGNLSNEVATEVQKKGFWFGNVGIKVRYADFTQVTRSRNLNHYSASEEDIRIAATLLLKDLIGAKHIRKVGVKVASLMEGKGQRKLF